jgi:hypothetical protein
MEQKDFRVMLSGTVKSACTKLPSFRLSDYAKPLNQDEKLDWKFTLKEVSYRHKSPRSSAACNSSQEAVPEATPELHPQFVVFLNKSYDGSYSIPYIFPRADQPIYNEGLCALNYRLLGEFEVNSEAATILCDFEVTSADRAEKRCIRNIRDVGLIAFHSNPKATNHEAADAEMTVTLSMVPLFKEEDLGELDIDITLRLLMRRTKSLMVPLE